MDDHSNIVMQKYKMGRLLGQGASGKVYYARSLTSGESVAIKVIDKRKVSRAAKLMEQIKREISTMTMVRHPNIVHLYEVMASKTKIYIVMEYAKGGELFGKLDKPGWLEEDVALKYFRQLITAVEFCHSRQVYHRDLKLENLLLDRNDNLKVTDFGLSALADSKRQDGLLHTFVGTPEYLAPEIIRRQGYDGVKADIWCCGVILYVLLAGRLPFRDLNVIELYRKIEKADYRFPKRFPKDARQLLMNILNPNPATRMSIDKIKENQWFRKDLIPKLIPLGETTRGNGDPCTSTGGNTDDESRQEFITRPAELNAFDIISLSRGFDLSGLFEGRDQRKEAGFTSRQPASVIISRLIHTANSLGLKVNRMDKGLLNFQGLNEGLKGVLSINAEIFEVTPALYLVEMRKANGDTLEYHKVLKEDVRPALRDIVWAWQGESNQQQLHRQPLQNQQRERQVQNQCLF